MKHGIVLASVIAASITGMGAAHAIKTTYYSEFRNIIAPASYLLRSGEQVTFSGEIWGYGKKRQWNPVKNSPVQLRTVLGNSDLGTVSVTSDDRGRFKFAVPVPAAKRGTLIRYYLEFNSQGDLKEKRTSPFNHRIK